MLSKEEIARAKERITKSLNDVLFSTLYSQEENEDDERILLAYIKELETKLESIYWEGYIQKQNEAMQICKQCKYINKSRELETKNQKLIEKLELEIEADEEDLKYNNLSDYGRGCLDEAKEILEILKGENDE